MDATPSSPSSGGEPSNPPAPESPAAVLDPARPWPARHRQRAAEDTPEISPEAEILTLAGQLQELVARRTQASDRAQPASTRLRPRAKVSGAAPPSPASEEITAVLTAARAAVPERKIHGPSAEERLAVASARWLRFTGWGAALLVLPAAAFLAGRMTAPPVGRELAVPAVEPASQTTRPTAAASSAATVPRWSEPSLARLNEAMGTQAAGDVKKALTLARELRDSAGPLPGLDLYTADLQARAGHAPEATALLFPFSRHEPVSAPACDRLGFLSARARRVDEAAGYFAQAAGADPFAGVYFYRWAEALRRLGKPTEALQRFDEALRRPRGIGEAKQAPPAALLKRELARLEAGQGEDVRRGIEEQLRAPQPGNAAQTGLLRMVAAAADLQDGRHVEAAAHLKVAREISGARPTADGGPSEFDFLLSDFFFRAYARRPELAGFFPAASSEADKRRVAALTASPDVYFVDP